MPSDENGSGDRGPWKNRQTHARPEVDAILGQGRDRLKGFLPDGLPPVRRLAVGAVIALAAFGAWSSWHTVPSDSVAIVQRLPLWPCTSCRPDDR